MFEKILIANRGEIAVRILQTCRKMGIRSVAVYSDIDFRNLHVTHADEAVPLGGTRPGESYLVKEKIIEAALKTNSQAIHPGYGFLSENAEFARMVSDAGLTFIGPSAEVISALGDKIAAKKLAAESGIPTVPGLSESITSFEEALSACEQIGFPVLLKPAAGGGGKGMRIVTDAESLKSALSFCQAETRKAFADDRIFIEKYISRPRHIEIQILADAHGNVLYLGERECSVQRRYQKIIEESPSVFLDKILRRKMGKLSCELARKAGYVNAGTIEYIMDQDRNFYFLEMNTRLQVEHPVTEMVTGLDLVELQIRIADREPLPLQQEDVEIRGWAMEARICTEDPGRGFIPSVGLITRYGYPKGENIRVDSGICAGSNINVYYDSMAAKVISWGEDREKARKNLVGALNRYHIEGVQTNIDFVNRILGHSAFVNGDLSTDFIPQHIENNEMPVSRENLVYMAIATTMVYHTREILIRDSLQPMRPQVGKPVGSQKAHEYIVKNENNIFRIRLQKETGELQWIAWIDDRKYAIEAPPFEFYRRRLKLHINGEPHYFRIQYSGNFIGAAFCGITGTFEIYSPREWKLAEYMPSPAEKVPDNLLLCPMPGLIVDIKVKKGDRIFKGQELLIIESMKMESGVASPCEGHIEDIKVSRGDAVETGAVLMSFAD